MTPDVLTWFHRSTTAAGDWDAARLRPAKVGTRVAVILPALNEAATVGAIVNIIRRDLVDCTAPLVDEVIVMDSGSTDETPQQAARAGARVLHRQDVLSEVPVLPGKGEAMWRATAATASDIIVFIDADLRSFAAEHVVGLLGPLLTDPQVHLVKAFYDRPYVTAAGSIPAAGGRVTELLARPLLNLCWPELAAVVQPLAGECAARRSLLEQLQVPTGYGVELAMLIDTYQLLGLPAIAQVDLGVRVHRHQGEPELGRMAAEVLSAAMHRLGLPLPSHSELAQFHRAQAGPYQLSTAQLSNVERPPLRDLTRTPEA